MAGGDDEMFMTRSLNVAPKTTEQHLIVSSVEFYLYPTVGTVLIHSVKPELTE